jgi:hypothetical protein
VATANKVDSYRARERRWAPPTQRTDKVSTVWVVRVLDRVVLMLSKLNNNRHHPLALRVQLSKARQNATRMPLRTRTMVRMVQPRVRKHSELDPTLTLIMVMEGARGTRAPAGALTTRVAVMETLI